MSGFVRTPGRQRSGSARRRGSLLHLMVALLATVALVPFSAIGASAQDVTTITVTSFTDDGETLLPFVRFQVTDDSSGAIYGPLEAPPGTAQVVFTIDLTDPDATFTIEEETPPACGIAPDPLTVGPLEAGDNLEIEFATEFDSSCDQGALSAYKYVCPDTFDASSTSYDDWTTGCTSTVDGATFTFTRVDSGFTFDAVTGAFGISGRAPYVGLDPGDYTIAETGDTGDSGDPTVFCLTYSSPNPAEAPGYESVAEVDLTNGAATVTLDNNRIACDFFYTQAQDDDDGGNTNGDDDGDNGDDEGSDDGDDDTGNADVGTGSIELHLAQCPAGYEPNDDIFDDCHGDGIAGIEFQVDGPSGYDDAAQTVIEESPGPGIVRFPNLAEGTYTIGEEIPGDAGSIFVYCSLAEADDLVPFEYNDTDGIDLELGDGINVICDWYQIPDVQIEESSIEITKFTCEVGYDAEGATYSDFLDDCSDPTQGVTFTVDGDNSDAIDRTTNSNGRARFQNLAADNYVVSEDVPGEFSTPYAFCSVDDGDIFQADTSDGVAYFQLDDSGMTVDCDWYNVPEDLAANASIQITKYQCPEGQSTAFAENCDEVIGGVEFQLSDGDGYDVSDTTGGNGRATFDGLTADTYTITEIPPSEPHVDVYVVSCAEGGSSKDFSYDDSTGLRINLKLSANDQVACNWYNVPAKPGPTGSITVEKYLCQGNDDNDYDWEDDCDPYTLGADFDLLDKAGKTLTSGTTNGDGLLVFTGLADGAYGLDETSADWCHAEADLVDAAGNVIVEDGGNTDVFIYNCTTKRVNRLPSTGVGTTATATAGMATTSGVAALSGGLAGLLMLLGLRQRRSALVTTPIRR